jgi:hypothetical protein
MDEPEEITDRRWRFNLIGAVESIARAQERVDLHNPELIPSFFDCVSDDYVPWGKAAMSDAELIAVHKLTDALHKTVTEAMLLKRQRDGGRDLVAGLRFRGGSVSEVPDPEAKDLAAAGWFAKVKPAARVALETFMLRGWMSEGLWETESERPLSPLRK